MWIVWIALLVAVVGCAPSFTRPATSIEQQARDEFECYRASILVSAYDGQVVNLTLMQRCMQARGYR